MAVEGGLGSMIDSALGEDVSSAPALSFLDVSNAIQIADPQFLFLGDYSRQNHDLRIDHNGATMLVEDYFAGNEANLAAPNGAFLSADTVKALAGPMAPGQYAQAEAAAPAATGLSQIGKVVSIEGTATATHSDGVTVTLKEGAPVYQGDVVQTGAGSKLGISFIDDSVFSMSADARMVLNELIFDPAKASESSMVVNLVQGSFVFVTGQVAPSGDMKVETPVATMGIRGTTPKVMISTDLGVTEFSILPDPDSGKIGSYVLLDKQTGEVLGTVESVGDKWVITSLSGEAVKVAKSGLDLLEDEIAMADIRAAVSSALGDRTYIDGANSFQQVAYNSSSSAAGPGGGSTGGNGDGTGNEGGGGVDPTPDKDDAPITGADAFTTGEEADGLPGGPTALSGNVFANNGGGVDYDPDGFGISLVQINGTPLGSWSGTLPSGASLVMNASGGFTYKPNDAFETLGLGESTTDVFTYTIRDPGGFMTTGQVTMTVTGRNDRPLIELTSVLTDAFSEQIGVTGSTTVLTATGDIDFSDVDTTDNHTISDPVFVSAVWNAGADPTTDPGSLVVQPVDQDGNSADWTYSIADNAVDFLGVGETLTITYTVTVVDDSGAGAGGNDGNESATSTTRQIVVTITGTNDAPEITSGPVTRIVAESPEDGGVGGGFIGTDTNPLNGTLNFTDVDVTDTGFTYEVVGVQEIRQSNDGTLPPTFTQINGSSAQSLLSLAGSNDSGTTGTDGTIVWTFTGTEDQFDYLAAGESVTLVYTVQVKDENGAVSNTQTVTITVVGATDASDNDAPVISVEVGDSSADDLIEGNGNLTTSGTLTVTEIDRTDDITLTVVGVEVSGTDFADARPSEADLQAMLILPTSPIMTDFVATEDTFTWTFDSGTTSFDYLGEGEKIVLKYEISASDGIGTDTQIVTVTITGTNDAPVIAIAAGDKTSLSLTESSEGPGLSGDGAFTATGGGALSLSGTISYSDVDVTDDHVASVEGVGVTGSGPPPPDTLDVESLLTVQTIQAGTDGTGGKVTWTFNGNEDNFDYLAAGETAVLTYTVRVTDQQGSESLSDEQTVTVTITGTNDAPDITVGANDSIAAQLDETNSGLNATGTLTVVDVDRTDTVTATVTGVTASNAEHGLTETELQAMLEVTSGDIAGDAGSESNLTWTFDSNGQAFDYLADGESLTLTYTITVTDQSGVSDTQLVTVKVIGTNDVPVIVSATDEGAIVEAATLIDSGSINFADADLSDRPTVEVSSSSVTATTQDGEGTLALTQDQIDAIAAAFSITPDGVSGSNTNNGSIDWTYSIAEGDIDFLGEGETVTAVFTVTVDDGNGGTVEQDVTITITGKNDAPVITSGPQGAAILETADVPTGTDADPESASGTITFGDVDLTDQPEVTVSDRAVTATTLTNGQQLTAGQEAALLAAFDLGATNYANGEGSVGWTYAPGNDVIDFLGEGEKVELTFTVTVTDDEGATDTQTVTITITGKNDAPVIVSATDEGTIAEALVLTDSGSIVFADVDLTDLPTAEVSNSSVTAVAVDGTTQLALTQDQIDAIAGAFSITPDGVSGSNTNDGSISWNYSIAEGDIDFLGEGETVTAVFTVTVDDGNGGTVEQDVTITITGKNDAPVIVSATDEGTIVEASALTDSGLIVFADLDLTDLPAAEVSNSSVTAVALDGTTSLALTQDQIEAIAGAFSITPDGVSGANTNDGSIAWTYSIAEGDIDFLGEGETVTAVFTVTVDDGNGGTVEQDVTITLTGANDAPVITAQVDDSIAETLAETDIGLSASGTLTVADVDRGSTVTATTVNVVAGGVTTGAPGQAALVAMLTVTAGAIVADSGAAGNLAWTFDSGDEAFDYLADGEELTLTYMVEVTDDAGATATQEVTVTITGSNDAPVITVDASGSVAEDVGETAGLLTDSGALSFTDADISDTQTVSSVYNADAVWSGGTLSPAQIAALTAGFTAGGTGWEYAVANADVQFLGAGETITLSYTVTVTDDSGAANASTSEVVTITVTGTNDAPVTGLDFVATDEDTQFTAGNVLTNDQDPDLSDSLEIVSFRVDGGSTTAAAGTVLQGALGALTISEDGTFSYELDTDLPFVQGLAGGSGTAEQFLYTTQDSSGAQVEERLTISIAGINDIVGDDDANTLDGTEERDRLSGLGDDDILNGLGGRDTLLGGLGDDQLFGGNGNDILFGGDGSDTLSGGLGADTFVFLDGESGVDTVLDFDTSQDFINLDDLLGTDFDPDAPIEISLVDNGSGSDLMVGGEVVAQLNGVADTSTINIVYDDTEQFAFSNAMNV